MTKNKLTSPNDSLQQASTREPSTRLDGGNTVSLTDASFSSSKHFLSGGAQIGGGTMKSYMQDHLSRMFQDIESTTKKLELEQRRVHKLDKDLAAADSEYAQKRQRYKLSHNSQDNFARHKGAEVRQVERRLEKAIADLNQSTSENEQLMKQIDQLRKERQVLDSVFQGMCRSITKKKSEAERLRASMDNELQMSEEAKQKKGALNKMLERERKAFAEHTMHVKAEVHKECDVQKEQEKLSNHQGAKSQGPMTADEEEAFSDESMHRRILKLSFLNTIQRRHIKQHQKNIEVFEQAFATIKSSTGISDIEEIVKIFVALEQRNFSLLTYVNQLNGEIEEIEKRNRELQSNLKDHQLGQVHAQDRKKAVLSEIETQIAKTREATKEKDKMIEDAASALNECRPLIWNIVKFLKIYMPVLVEGGYEGDVPTMKQAAPDEHDEHLNHHLSYIEEAILQFRVCLGEGALLKARGLPQHKASHSINGVKKAVEPPSAHITGDDSDDDPVDGLGDKPLSWNELRERALLRQARKKRPGQQGKQSHSQDTAADEDEVGDASVRLGRRDAGPPPPKEAYAASSVTSKDSGGEPLPSGSAALSKSPSVSGKLPSDSKDPSRAEDGEAGDGKAPFRDEMWWRGQSKR